MVVVLSILCGFLLIGCVMGWFIVIHREKQIRNLFPCTLLLNFKQNKKDNSEQVITDLSEYKTDGIVSMTLILPLYEYIRMGVQLMDTSYVFAHAIMRRDKNKCELVSLGEEGPV